MMKFVWCPGHQGSGQFDRTGLPNKWQCFDCGTVIEKIGTELNQEHKWKLVQEVFDDPDQGAV